MQAKQNDTTENILQAWGCKRLWKMFPFNFWSSLYSHKSRSYETPEKTSQNKSDTNQETIRLRVFTQREPAYKSASLYKSTFKLPTTKLEQI